ncbi:MAG: type II toxin-antitoxin system HicA family toxin [Actinomycetales bacterium]|nr:type II toxin-antitoxin system HicA family toxin [Actinomycetales bacterium]
MSPALPVVSGQETVTALEKNGFAQVGQRGSHVKLRDQVGRTVIVPIHRELARGTLSGILRQAGVTVGEFIDLL